MSSFYVTTPIYYVNGAPHIGHAYTTIVADTLARYHRQRGEQVFFMTGTDEHGLKVQRAAEQRGMTPLAMADENSARFRTLFDSMKLSYDRFIRTTEPDHARVVQTLFETLRERGDIYLGEYEGWYAASDEAFYAEDEIQDGKAIATGATVEWVAERSYFFRLSAYRERLLEWYREQPGCVQPEARYNEVYSFVEGELHDLSISRTTFDWGIPVPGDPEHVMYVWLDALANYITGVGAFSDAAAWSMFWPCDLHLIGKDILRFHAVYWPAFLMSAGLPLPRTIFAHGWWLNEGVKMSKSLGNFIDAFELLETAELDVLRYYMLREVPFGNDGNFSHRNLIMRNNSELADNLGNLVNRTFRMTERFLAGKIPARAEVTSQDEAIVARAKQARDAVDAHMLAIAPHRAVEEIMAFSGDLNQYVHHNQPWKLAKDEGQRERLEQVLYHTIEGIRWVAVLAASIMPEKMPVILKALGDESDGEPSLAALESWGGLRSGATLQIPPVLFEKQELPPEPEQEASAPAPTPPKAEAKKKPQADERVGLVDFKAFQQIELMVAKILSAERVEGSDRLLKLSVDLAEDAPRTVVAGIAAHYQPETLIGLHVAAVANLKPAKIFGIPSQAMLLAVATQDGGLLLTQYPETVLPGTRIS